jgi:mRNA-degrading endonuclease RelE of RelBE toxin-antitoxin system
MRYTVDWLPDPLSALTAIWLRTADRKAITRAQATIDRLLATDPIRNGTPLSEGLHSLEVFPLRVVFEVDTTSRVVTVVSVGHLP